MPPACILIFICIKKIGSFFIALAQREICKDKIYYVVNNVIIS